MSGTNLQISMRNAKDFTIFRTDTLNKSRHTHIPYLVRYKGMTISRKKQTFMSTCRYQYDETV